jgi:hypothetical protein
MESGGIAPSILNDGTKWRWPVNFTPPSLCFGERIPTVHWTQAGLDAVEIRKTSALLEINPHSTVIRPALIYAHFLHFITRTNFCRQLGLSYYDYLTSLRLIMSATTEWCLNKITWTISTLFQKCPEIYYIRETRTLSFSSMYPIYLKNLRIKSLQEN